ncbi:MAG: hypothetical protein GX061_02725 [Eubacteriaceae bacterium]|nr:hypothetical protein [Eubacteriaceae bacterium]
MKVKGHLAKPANFHYRPGQNDKTLCPQSPSPNNIEALPRKTDYPQKPSCHAKPNTKAPSQRSERAFSPLYLPE